MVEKITPAEAIRLLDAGKAQAVDVREPDAAAVPMLHRSWKRRATPACVISAAS